MRQKKSRVPGFVAGLAAVVVAFSGLVVGAAPAQAITGADFNPGYIISDANFYNPNAMSQPEIQAFLDARIGACQNSNCLNIKSVNTATRPADAMCREYVGGSNEPTSLVIFKVQQACDISAKVLLVNLQKEQGLVTHKAPSDARLDRAMGYACPDNPAAPGWCDPAYGGLYNQIYRSAWQFKRYGNPPGTSNFFNWYPVGVASQIRYSPNAACGSSSVVVQNRATAALYYYTPYQPNASALANLGGVGDACGAYGNRNFWVYYNNWFGPTTATGLQQLTELYQSQGGGAGWLGGAIGSLDEVSNNGGGLRQPFSGGTLYWSNRGGARIVSGAILGAYNGASGVLGSLGWPTGNVTETRVNGAGQYQRFQGGAIYWTAANGARVVVGDMSLLYDEVSGADGFLGWPTTAAAYDSANGGGLRQSFQSGVIFWSAGTGARIVSGSILTAYSSLSAQSGALGWPTGPVGNVTANGGGTAQSFQYGSIYWTAANGAFPVSGAIRSAYWAQLGEGGVLGWPKGAPVTVTTGGGGLTQAFQSGTIYSSNAGGARALYGPIRDAYVAAGAIGTLGWPSSDVIPLTVNGGGSAQAFQGGSIYRSAAGAFVVSGAIRDYYFGMLGEGGTLGFPTGVQQCGLADGGCSQTFQNGTILWSATLGARLKSGSPEIDAAYATLGGPAGALGNATSIVVSVAANGGGKAQAFQRGSIYFSAAAGAFPVSGPIRDAYWSQLGEGGALGWPTGGPVAVTANGGGTAQAFQGGSIYSSPKGGARVVTGPIRDAYVLSQGESGALGWPTSSVISLTVNGGGTAQAFQGGSIYATTAGAYVVSGPVRDFYWSLLGEGGTLGFPTGPAQCGLADGGCSQVFQNGTILWSPATGARLQTIPEIDAVYVALGGANGVLGAPTGRLVDVAANGGGKAQGYQKGSVYWTAASGAYAVTGPIRDAYWNRLGEGGTLGWPTSVSVCDPAGACVQTFQNGSIAWSAATGATVR